jgi:hypothetical protein
MIMHVRLAPAEAASRSGLPLSRRVASLAMRFADWITAAADHYAAAAAYEQLSRLSDAELQRRGLSRATLAQDICATCHSTARR